MRSGQEATAIYHTTVLKPTQFKARSAFLGKPGPWIIFLNTEDLYASQSPNSLKQFCLRNGSLQG